MEQGDFVVTSELVTVDYESRLGDFPRLRRAFTGVARPQAYLRPGHPGIVIADHVGPITDMVLVLIDGQLVAAWPACFKIVRSMHA